jgi:hypothetical protein
LLYASPFAVFLISSCNSTRKVQFFQEVTEAQRVEVNHSEQVARLTESRQHLALFIKNKYKVRAREWTRTTKNKKKVKASSTEERSAVTMIDFSDSLFKDNYNNSHYVLNDGFVPDTWYPMKKILYSLCSPSSPCPLFLSTDPSRSQHFHLEH